MTDTGAGAGTDGDLRFCIAQANMNPGPDLIDATGVTGVILLNGELPTINDDLVITGPGAGLLSVDGQLSYRLFQVNTGGGKQVDFRDLRFVQGQASGIGGAVLVNNATATFGNCVFNACHATTGGAVAGTASSTVEINYCTLSGNSGTTGGGAVYSAGTLKIRSSTLSANSTALSGSGGAVVLLSASAAEISNSTISGNTAGSHGGGIRTSAAFTGQLHLKNTTITQNSVASGTGTGRGVSVGGSGGTVLIDSTIVAQNSGGASNTSDVSGNINAAYSLFGTTDAATIAGNGNFKGTNMAPVDAKLGPLANNGGPTLTHLPMDDSPAREAGITPDLLTEDQRGKGYSRLEGYAVDIGSVETYYFRPMAENNTIYVTQESAATTFQFQVTYVDNRGSGLVDVSTLGTGDLLIIGPTGTYYETPQFVSATPNVDAQTIVATYQIPVPVNLQAGWDKSDNGIYPLIILPNEVFDRDTPPQVGETVAFTFLVVAIPNVYSVDEVSDVTDMDYSPGHLSFREALLLANADGDASSITFDPSVFNAATTITLNGSGLNITDGITIDGPAAPLTIDGNYASRIFNTTAAPANAKISVADMMLTRGFASNIGDQNGGAILATSQDITLNRVTIADCKAADRGGAIMASMTSTVTSSFIFRDCNIINNKCGSFGGAFHFVGNYDINIERSTLADNRSNSTGGAIDAYGVRRLVLLDSTVSGNRAGVSSGLNSFDDGVPRGGGIYFRSSWTGAASSLIVTNSTISGNSAVSASVTGAGVGGGISLQNGSVGSFIVSNSTITGNVSGSQGGGIRIVYGETAINSSIVAGNSSPVGRDIYCLNYVNRGPVQVIGANNLIGDGNIGKSTLAPGSMTGTTMNPLDAKLAPLASNGGPTKTHALLAGSPAINAGSNPLGLVYDQRGTGFTRVSGSGVDIGAFETRSPARIMSITFNDGGIQRSRVTSLTIVFDQIVTLPSSPSDAFDLVRQSDGKHPPLNATVDNSGSGTIVTLTFLPGDAVEFGSLADGRYNLTVFDTLVSNVNGILDGDANGVPGGNYVLIGNLSNRLFRLFGDADGSGQVNSNDFLAFRLAFLSSDDAFDFDGNGTVDSGDFLQFRLRFLASV
ncbi:MAG: hypothetical protein K1X57_07885 [Gemmataceae bacterium]|nr:hypothetical protein [Gemmataceae bacterium]